MVVFLDLEADDDEPGYRALPQHYHRRLDHRSLSGDHSSSIESEGCIQNEVPAKNGELFASALACYPAALSLASHLDLNDLFALSTTCRRVHQCLVQFAPYLRAHSLHCVNDTTIRSADGSRSDETETSYLQEIAEQVLGIGSGTPAFPWPHVSDTNQFHGIGRSPLGLSGRVGKCARDLVASCHKCSVVVCRNCAVKPPSARCLPDRLRRLCRTCLDAPLLDHLVQLQEHQDCHDSPPASSASSTRSTRTVSSASSSFQTEPKFSLQNAPFTASAFLRAPCSCAARGVFLCEPCGQNVRSADITYKRVWTWRSRYSTHIGGGLGTGLGQGNQGQKCGRAEHCLERGAAGVCWVEIECSEARAAGRGVDEWMGSGRSVAPFGSRSEHEHAMNKPGYLSQEMEGIGGVVKKKVKKRIRVGATVYEFNDERESGKYLEREVSGRERSWCGWCFRLCPDQKDLGELQQMLS